MKKVSILTYQCVHRKTYDTLCLLKAKGYTEVTIYAAPLSYQKSWKPLLEHRPGLPYGIREGIDWHTVVRNLGFPYVPITNYNEIPTSVGEIFLVCGAGILPDSFVQNHLVINAHPGYLPYERGLDAFKWAVLENHPIGVTTHFIGKEVDAGEILQRRKVPIYSYDTFHLAAQRQYEMEIAMLVEALEHIDEKHEIISTEGFPVHKRMPHEYEMKLLEKFEQIKKKG